MEHLVNDLLHCRLQAWTFPAGIEARWLGEGILQLLPTAPWRQATILSAGVHGNETAPIELLLQLTHDLSQGRQPLTQALLIVFGNLPAIRAARRYLHNDLNRLFGGRHLAVTPGNESRRAFALEQAVQAFYRAADAAGPVNRGHLDMHTAIRGSLYRQFALLPAHAGDFSPDFYQLLQASGIDVYKRQQQHGINHELTITRKKNRALFFCGEYFYHRSGRARAQNKPRGRVNVDCPTRRERFPSSYVPEINYVRQYDSRRF